MAEVTPRRRLIKINAILQAQLIKLLLEDEYSCEELAQETGLNYITVLQYTRELHRAGAAHIVRYEKDRLGRDSIKVYKLGAGKDAKRARLSPAQRQQRQRDRKKMATLLGLTHEVPALQSRRKVKSPGVEAA
jgi:hypothetical protein